MLHYTDWCYPSHLISMNTSRPGHGSGWNWDQCGQDPVFWERLWLMSAAPPQPQQEKNILSKLSWNEHQWVGLAIWFIHDVNHFLLKERFVSADRIALESDRPGTKPLFRIVWNRTPQAHHSQSSLGPSSALATNGSCRTDNLHVTRATREYVTFFSFQMFFPMNRFILVLRCKLDNFWPIYCENNMPSWLLTVN